MADDTNRDPHLEFLYQSTASAMDGFREVLERLGLGESFEPFQSSAWKRLGPLQRVATDLAPRSDDDLEARVVAFTQIVADGLFDDLVPHLPTEIRSAHVGIIRKGLDVLVGEALEPAIEVQLNKVKDELRQRLLETKPKPRTD
jgi:hypothetical protein